MKRLKHLLVVAMFAVPLMTFAGTTKDNAKPASPPLPMATAATTQPPIAISSFETVILDNNLVAGCGDGVTRCCGTVTCVPTPHGGIHCTDGPGTPCLMPNSPDAFAKALENGAPLERNIKLKP